MNFQRDTFPLIQILEQPLVAGLKLKKVFLLAAGPMPKEFRLWNKL